MYETMKKIYLFLLLSVLASAPAFAAPEVNPDDLDLPESRWEMRYDCYESLWDDSPEYRNLSREITIKGTYGTIYIKGIFDEYPDAWISGRRHSNLFIDSGQILSQDGDNTVYFQLGDCKFSMYSANDREYSVVFFLYPKSTSRWDCTNDSDSMDSHYYSTLWFSDKNMENVGWGRTYHFDGTITGDDFGPRPILLNTSFHKIDQSGITDTVIETERTEDTRPSHPRHLYPRRPQVHRALTATAARRVADTTRIFGIENFSLTLRIGGKNV